METKRIEIVYVEIDKLKTFDENPNVQTDKTFNLLVESIREGGMFDPIDVVPSEEGYKIIGGEHRYRACRLLGHEEVPVIIHEGYDEDRQKLMLVKLNQLRGKLSPDKFVKLYREMSTKYSDEILKTMMGFESEEAMQKLLGDVKANLPPELRDKVNSSKQEVKNVDDLALLLNKLFRDHGSTLKFSFMIFDFGGKQHHWIRLTKEAHEAMCNIEDLCEKNKIDINELLGGILSQAKRDADKEGELEQ